MRGLIAAAPVALALGCAGLGYQDDGFRDRLRGGCDSVEQCERLAADAEIRAGRCRPNTIGYLRCDDAKADMINARVLVQRQRDAQAQLQAAREAQQRAELQRQEAERLRLETEKRSRIETVRTARETEQALLQEEQRAVAETERLKLLGRAGRDRELRRCYKSGEVSCRVVLQALLEVADSEAEKRALVALDQQLAGGSLRPATSSGP
jgi:hypothetical protein